jgi:2-dehydropantoate 2-reductase
VRFAVLGAGGVGGYFGARLAAAGHQVTFVARGRNLVALQANGIVVRSPYGDLAMPVDATDDPSKAAGAQVVLFAVKGHGLAAALPTLTAMLGPDTWVIAVQNGGLAPAEQVAAAIGDHRVVGGGAYISCHLRAPGVLEHHPGPKGMSLGEWTGPVSPRLTEFAQTARAAEIDVELVDDVKAMLWGKFAFISALSGGTASTGRSIGEVRATESGARLVESLLREASAVARAEGVALPADYERNTIGLLHSLDGGMRSSLYEDLSHGRPCELEELQGEVVRRAARVGVPVPVTATVHAVLEPWAAGARPIWSTP